MFTNAWATAALVAYDMLGNKWLNSSRWLVELDINLLVYL
jgi:hypothetical protein